MPPNSTNHAFQLATRPLMSPVITTIEATPRHTHEIVSSERNLCDQTSARPLKMPEKKFTRLRRFPRFLHVADHLVELGKCQFVRVDGAPLRIRPARPGR